MAAEKPIVHRPGSGQAFWMLGGLYEVLLSSEESDGAMSVLQMTMPAGSGPPPHVHPGSEMVYVVEGALTYHIGGELIEGGPGSLFHIPAGTLEWFEPTTTTRVLVTYRPGGIEKFLPRRARRP